LPPHPNLPGNSEERKAAVKLRDIRDGERTTE
jgi:hypothetical protein